MKHSFIVNSADLKAAVLILQAHKRLLLSASGTHKKERNVFILLPQIYFLLLMYKLFDIISTAFSSSVCFQSDMLVL